MGKVMRNILIALAVIILLSLVLSFEPISKGVSKVTGVAQDKLRSVAQTVASIGIGVLLVLVGVQALATSVILGGVLLVIGVVLLATAVWPLFNRPKVLGE